MTENRPSGAAATEDRQITAGTRVSAVLMSTLVGMALGGWMTGAVFDYTGSYQAAFINGVLWNVLNIFIVLWLMSRRRPATPAMAPA